MVENVDCRSGRDPYTGYPVCVDESLPDPPPGLLSTIGTLLAHERELWEVGIDAPAWYPRRRGDGDPQH